MRSACLLLALAAVLAPYPARADTPQQVRQQLQTITNRTAAAVIHKNLPGFLAAYAPSYVFTDITGHRENFLQVQAGMAARFARPRPIGMLTHTVGPVTLHGNTAQTLLTLRNGIVHPRISKDGTYTFTRVFQEQSTWVKGPKGWQETSAQMVRDVTTYSR